MAVEIDGVLKEWGDRMFVVRSRARPAPKTIAGKKSKPARPPKPPKPMSASGARAAFSRLARRVPEVTVKITQGRKDPETGLRPPIAKDMKSIKAHFDYLARHGDVLEDEQGNQIAGAADLLQLRDDWQYTGGYAIPADDGYRREAYGIVLSMPPGTDKKAVLDAARDFAKDTFSGHQYVFAQHTNEAHPHVHLAVKAVSRDLVRLNPRKPDLHQWRESFAEKLREHGIEANASSRVLRGQTQKAERQPVRHIEKRVGQSKARRARYAEARQEAASGIKTEHPSERKLRSTRVKVVSGLGEVAKALAGSALKEDRALALGLARHVGEFKDPATSHRKLVDELLRTAAQERGAGNAEPNKPVPRERDK
ncbi:putative DNA relaxase/nickase, TraS/VirD2-like protein [Xanthomonas citri pv. fuscans]|nr:putative DNA relaxase/nickase, TraS/VirD2-like protein [Xanthomonas citri pv. fuscans]